MTLRLRRATQREFDCISRAYSRLSVERAEREVREVVAWIAPRRDEWVLDAACGPARLAQALAPRLERVCAATDASPSSISWRQKSPLGATYCAVWKRCAAVFPPGFEAGPSSTLSSEEPDCSSNLAASRGAAGGSATGCGSPPPQPATLEERIASAACFSIRSTANGAGSPPAASTATSCSTTPRGGSCCAPPPEVLKQDSHRLPRSLNPVCLKC